MKQVENDMRLMVDVISHICDYARDNDMRVTDTLKTVAENILAICEIADFDGWKKGGARKNGTNSKRTAFLQSV